MGTSNGGAITMIELNLDDELATFTVQQAAHE